MKNNLSNAIVKAVPENSILKNQKNLDDHSEMSKLDKIKSHTISRNVDIFEIFARREISSHDPIASKFDQISHISKQKNRYSWDSLINFQNNNLLFCIQITSVNIRIIDKKNGISNEETKTFQISEKLIIKPRGKKIIQLNFSTYSKHDAVVDYRVNGYILNIPSSENNYLLDQQKLNPENEYCSDYSFPFQINRVKMLEAINEKYESLQ